MYRTKVPILLDAYRSGPLIIPVVHPLSPPILGEGIFNFSVDLSYFWEDKTGVL